MSNRTTFDAEYLPYLIAYFYQCAASDEYPDVEIAGRLLQVDHSIRSALRIGHGKTASFDDRTQALIDAWILLAFARVHGCRGEMTRVSEDALAIGAICSQEGKYKAAKLRVGSLTLDDVGVLERLLSRTAYFHGEIGGTLLRSAELGQPTADVSDALTEIQAHMRYLRDLMRLLRDSLTSVRGAVSVNTVSAISEHSLEWVSALSEILPAHLVPSEQVAIAAPATWANFADEAGIGTFEGVLLVTSENVRFIFNPFHHENAWDLTDGESFPLSQVIRFVRTAHKVTIDDGYQMRVGDQLELFLKSERVWNPRHWTFYVPKTRMREFTKFRP
jgi:hypothetical protein